MTASKARTLLALDESIAHWERLLSGEDYEITSEECSLCTRLGSCFCCPLSAWGMKCNSYDSPYQEVANPSEGAKFETLPAVRSPELTAAIETMLMCLLLVREAEANP